MGPAKIGQRTPAFDCGRRNRRGNCRLVLIKPRCYPSNGLRTPRPSFVMAELGPLARSNQKEAGIGTMASGNARRYHASRLRAVRSKTNGIADAPTRLRRDDLC